MNIDEIKAVVRHAVAIEAVKSGHSITGKNEGPFYWRLYRKESPERIDMLTEDEAKYIEIACNMMPWLLAYADLLKTAYDTSKTTLELANNIIIHTAQELDKAREAAK